MDDKFEEETSEDFLEPPAFDSFSSILDLYHKYIKGEISSSITHAGPLMKETECIKDLLLYINEAGILTLNSQPGMMLKTEDDIQRAYLECYMPEHLYFHIEKALMATEIIIFGERVVYENNENDKNTEETCCDCDRYYYIPVTLDNGEVFTSLPLEYGFYNDLEHLLENTEESAKDIILKDLYYVRFLDPIWKRERFSFEKIVSGLQS